MVSTRCKLVVRDALNKLGLHFVIINLGEVDVMEELTEIQKESLGKILQDAGLELMEDKKAVLIAKAKKCILDFVLNRVIDTKIDFSNYISKKLECDYSYLATIFSAICGITIEKYMIVQKVERVKELIMYNELTITEIAWQMNYSSVAHLCTQFKKVTGLTPTHFKNLKEKIKVSNEENNYII